MCISALGRQKPATLSKCPKAMVVRPASILGTPYLSFVADSWGPQAVSLDCGFAFHYRTVQWLALAALLIELDRTVRRKSVGG